jgi:hypothetical protein
MKTRFFYKILVLVILLFFFNNLQASSLKDIGQDDPVLAPEIETTPLIDGIGNDQCWQDIPWQGIDHVWIPDTLWGNITSEDYSGHYKMAWSSASNLLYFLVEVTDDNFVDGFVPGVTADVYNFDIIEVFIDENASGGEHRYDGPSTNAENAFAYHIYADYPEEGETNSDLYVGDMATTPPNYASHFPEFSLRRTGNFAVWEFSLKVYNDTYSPTNVENARVTLQVDKVMGLSVAYCENDNPNENPKVRDNMFGSVWEPSPGNLHWINADNFGNIKLVSDISTGVIDAQITQTSSIKVYPNPSSSHLQLELDNAYTGEISIRLYNILGQEVFQTSDLKTDRLFTKTLSLDYLSSGIYFLQTQLGKTSLSKKLLITKN